MSLVWENVESWLVFANDFFWIAQPNFLTNITKKDIVSFFFLLLKPLTVMISLSLETKKRFICIAIEKVCWVIERVNEHSGKDINSHMFKHSMAANHSTMTLDDFTILRSGYRKRKFDIKISESLFIKHNRPTLNKHGTSVPLKLFNW